MSLPQRFSVVVPTRDRPELLSFCLESLSKQTFEEFEVIVADNFTSSPARAVFDRWARAGWRYLTPPRALAMHDNFEFACDQAAGTHVSVMIDKTVLHPTALTTAALALDATDSESVDIVTWWNEGFDPLSEEHGEAHGLYRPTTKPVPGSLYNTREELDRRFLMEARRGTDGKHYFRGKIVFGTFSRRLLDQIKMMTGRVFHPLSPDYTSMVPALVFARSALDVGRPLMLSVNSARSNGRQGAVDPTHARGFIETADPGILRQLPIPGLYCAVHNVVAYDYVTAASRCPAGSTPELDRSNLVRRAREDLAAMQWTDMRERASQYAILEAAEAELGVDPSKTPPAATETASTRGRLAALLAHTGPFERLAYRIAGRPTFEEYSSPVAAAKAADSRYTIG